MRGIVLIWINPIADLDSYLQNGIRWLGEAAGRFSNMAGRRWTEREDDQLVDLIYDAVFDEAVWPSVLERIGDRAGAHPGNLTQLNFLNGSGTGLAARAPDDIMMRYFADWADRNPIALADDAASYTVGWKPRITRDSESVDRRSLERSAFWNDFLVPIGAHHLTILRLSLHGTDVTTITLGRPDRLGAFEDDEIAMLARFHPHLVRADKLSRRLGFRQAAFDRFDHLLETSSDPLFFLDDLFRPLHWTAGAEGLLARGGTLRVADGRLAAVDGTADALLRRALVAALEGGSPQPVVLPATPAQPGVTLSVARLGERALNGLAGTRCLLVSARTVEPPSVVATLHARFGLTTAECDLAEALAAGETLRAVATRRNVSINTVRNQLSAVFDKTDCRRQQDLVRLLSSRA